MGPFPSIPNIKRVVADAQSAVFDLLERRLILGDSILLRCSLGLLEMTYDLIDDKRKALVLEQLKFSLRHSHGIKPGIMLRCTGPVAVRSEISQEKLSDRKWNTIPIGDYIMYLDVVYDENYDLPTLQVLWDQKIVFVHHDSKSGKLYKKFGEKFEVVKKS